VSASWHFNVDSKGPIHLQARFEGTHSEIKPGQNFRNLTYGQLKRAGAGTIRVNADGSLTMTSAIRSADRPRQDAGLHQARLHRHRPVVASKGFTLEQPKRIKSV
jgi:hypothetical protein